MEFSKVYFYFILSFRLVKFTLYHVALSVGSITHHRGVSTSDQNTLPLIGVGIRLCVEQHYVICIYTYNV